MEYIDFWVTRNGAKPINRKIEDMTNLAPPTSRKEVRKFVGVIKHYRNMWPRWSHTLVTLTKLTYIKRNFEWKEVEKYDFEK